MMDEEEFCYCHNDDTDEYHDCLDYMECEECPYYYADLYQESDLYGKFYKRKRRQYNRSSTWT